MTDKQQKQDTIKTFDMYRFFSRKDVVAVIVLILFLLVYAVASFFGGGSA